MPIDKRTKDYVDSVIKEVRGDPRFKDVKLDPRDVKKILDAFTSSVIKAIKRKWVVNLRYFILFPFPKDKSRLKFLVERRRKQELL